MFFQGGREVLIKAVALSILTYAMNCFKLPGSLCFELKSMVVRFWWGQKKRMRGGYTRSIGIRCVNLNLEGV